MINTHSTIRHSIIGQFVYILLSALLPLCFTICWLLKNTQLPTSDAATYLYATVDIYQHFIHHGLWKGLINVFYDRGSRPIFFPAFTTPFMLLAHGNLQNMIVMVVLTCVFASAVYVYLLLRLVLSRFSAIIATNLVVLSPFVLAENLNFFGEAAFFPCLLGGIYHLIKADYFRHTKHTMGFVALTALAACLRPVEFVMHFMPILIFLFCIGWHKKIFSTKQIITVIGLCVVALFAFLIACAFSHFYQFGLKPGINLNDLYVFTKFSRVLEIFTLVILLGTSIQYCKQWFQKRRQEIKQGVTKPLLIPVVMLILAVMLIWFIPFANDTFQWIYQDSFGDVAVATKLSESNMSLLDNVLLQINGEGFFVATSVLLAGIGGFFILRKKEKLLYTPVMYLLLMSVLPICEVIFTFQNTYRKVSAAIPALLMVLLIFALHQGRAWKSRASFICVVLVLQFVFLSYTVLNGHTANKYLNLIVGNQINPPISIDPNPHVVVNAFLAEQARIKHFSYIRIMVNDETLEPIDPFLLATLAHTIENRYEAGDLFFGKYSPENMRLLRNEKHPIFLSDSIHRMVVSPLAANEYMRRFIIEKNPNIKTMYEFLYYYSTKQLAAHGWDLSACKVIKARTDEYLGCVLMPLPNYDSGFVSKGAIHVI
jgi:hypothetical protein